MKEMFIEVIDFDVVDPTTYSFHYANDEWHKFHNIYITSDGKRWNWLDGMWFEVKDGEEPQKGYKFSNRSKSNLATCHPKLQKIFNEVIKHTDCIILEGHRTIERQKELVAKGVSKTMNSKHLSSPSRAVDVAPFPLDWDDIKGFKNLGKIVIYTADKLGIKIEWGGDWNSFKDYPHYQLANEEK
jgi:hypothetical protein